MTGQAWIRLRDARPLIEWVIRDAIEECGLTVHVLPEEIISDREALSRLLAEQLRNLGERKALELEKRWEARWQLMAAAEFRKLPENIQN
jgi:hypothetical protein